MILRIILLILLSASYSYSYACDCIESSMDVNYTKATLVFYGEVINTGTLKETTFKVTQWFKPSHKRESEVSLAAGKTDCDLFFNLGDKWLIFANGNPPKARQCGGSRLLESYKQKNLASHAN